MENLNLTSNDFVTLINMNSVFLENSYIESVIAGLKNLYEELVIDEKEKELM